MFRLAAIGIATVSMMFLPAHQSAFGEVPCVANEVPDASSFQSPSTEMYSVNPLSGHGTDEHLVYLANSHDNLVLEGVWLEYVSDGKRLLSVPIETSTVSETRVMFAIALDGDLAASVRIRWSYVEPDVDCPDIEYFEVLLAVK